MRMLIGAIAAISMNVGEPSPARPDCAVTFNFESLVDGDLRGGVTFEEARDRLIACNASRDEARIFLESSGVRTKKITRFESVQANAAGEAIIFTYTPKGPPSWSNWFLHLIGMSGYLQGNLEFDDSGALVHFDVMWGGVL